MLITQASRNATKAYFELYWDFHTSDKYIVTMSFGSLHTRCNNFMQCVSMYLALTCQALDPSSEMHICLIIYLT